MDKYKSFRDVPESLPDAYTRIGKNKLRQLMRKYGFAGEDIAVDVLWRGDIRKEPLEGKLCFLLRKNWEVVLCLDISVSRFKRLKDVVYRVSYKRTIENKWSSKLNMARRRLLHIHERMRSKAPAEYIDQRIIDEIKGDYNGNMF